MNLSIFLVNGHSVFTKKTRKTTNKKVTQGPCIHFRILPRKLGVNVINICLNNLLNPQWMKFSLSIIKEVLLSLSNLSIDLLHLNVCLIIIVQEIRSNPMNEELR